MSKKDEKIKLIIAKAQSRLSDIDKRRRTVVIDFLEKMRQKRISQIRTDLMNVSKKHV